MAVVRFEDARAFRSAVQSLIGASEARHNLVYGILGTLIDDPSMYEEHRLWLVEREGAAVAAALRTPPMKLVLCDAVDEKAARELARAIASEPEQPPGAIGNTPTIEWFAQAWTSATGSSVEQHHAQGVFALDEVVDAPRPPGSPRLATTRDHDLIVEWLERFAKEALPNEAVDRARYRAIATRVVEQRRGSGAWLWARDDTVASLSAHGNPTPNGMRIGPVYTPPPHRGQGFATALVAHQSAELLASGHRFCFLFTDLANPTSNAIYRRIGYRQVAEAMDCGFAEVETC